MTCRLLIQNVSIEYIRSWSSAVGLFVWGMVSMWWQSVLVFPVYCDISVCVCVFSRGFAPTWLCRQSYRKQQPTSPRRLSIWILFQG